MTFEWKSLVKTLAPTLATALGGPLAGTAVKVLSQAILGTDTGTEKEISDALQSADPEMILKIKQANNDFSLKMKELDINLDEIEYKDRDSARDREVATGDNVNKILAYALVTAFILTVGFTLAGYAKAETVLAGTLIGYLSAKCEQVLTYYFGSNKSSSRKTELLAQAEAVKKG